VFSAVTGHLGAPILPITSLNKGTYFKFEVMFIQKTKDSAIIEFFHLPKIQLQILVTKVKKICTWNAAEITMTKLRE